MVGPVNGASAQQVQIANPFQTDNNRQTQEIQQREQDTNRAQSTNETNQTETNNQENTQPAQVASASDSQQTQRAGGSEQERGSIVDISV